MGNPSGVAEIRLASCNLLTIPLSTTCIILLGAHDTEFESIDDAKDAFIPSAGLLSMAQSVQSPAMAAAFNPYENAGKIHQLSMESDGLNIDDLEEMGGDPSFLDDPEEDEPKAEEDDGGFFWDGEVNEDAWLD